MTAHEQGGGRYGVARAEELSALLTLSSESFGVTLTDAQGFFTNAGADNLRSFHLDGELAGMLILVPMGQYWGGREVSLGGVAGVATAAERRGHGGATQMMSEALRELRGRGFALSGLYPATQPLYRRVGFEQAGTRFHIRVPVASLPRAPHGLRMRRFQKEDLDAVKRLYAAHARLRAGYLTRGSYIWNRVEVFRGQPASGFVVEDADGLAGYLFYLRERRPDGRLDFVLTDAEARTPEAWTRLLSFLGHHGSMGDDVVWHGSDRDARLLVTAEQRWQVRVKEVWMLRLLDVAAAMTQRGWPTGFSGQLSFELTDSLFPENAGRFTLEVSGGEGRWRTGGEGALKVDVRPLAALYSGHRTATQLASIDWLKGPPEALALADALFAGPAPSMPDMF